MSKMRLADWANLAEVIGGIAVVFSLLYVGVQVRENTEEIRATNRQALIGRAHDATIRFASTPDLSALISKAAEGASLTEPEAVQYGYLVRAVLYDVQEAFALNREGRLADAYWNTRAAVAKQYLTTPAARAIYERDKVLGTLLPDFIEWLDQALED